MYQIRKCSQSSAWSPQAGDKSRWCHSKASRGNAHCSGHLLSHISPTMSIRTVANVVVCRESSSLGQELIKTRLRHLTCLRICREIAMPSFYKSRINAQVSIHTHMPPEMKSRISYSTKRDRHMSVFRGPSAREQSAWSFRLLVGLLRKQITDLSGEGMWGTFSNSHSTLPRVGALCNQGRAVASSKAVAHW